LSTLSHVWHTSWVSAPRAQQGKRPVLSPRPCLLGARSRIEGVVGHEYFHNWTGNRVTCRDWFQLTLKEGLTVYRDQVRGKTVRLNASCGRRQIDWLIALLADCSWP
jgi:hypothetical protein